jgi:adenylate cyclase
LSAHAQVRDEVERILSSPKFVRSARLGRFLRYAVERTLEERTGDLKESVLAMEVFDRKPDYDSRIDSVVRVEARRLRSKLREYYETEGRNAALVLDIPEGTYVPRWSSGPPSHRSTSATGSVAVLPFANLSPDPDQEYFCDGITDEILVMLSRTQGLKVVARTSAFQFKNSNVDIREIGSRLGAGVIVEGGVRKAGDQVRITAQIVDAASGYQLASKTLDGSLQDVFAMQERTAAAVAESLAAALNLAVASVERPDHGDNVEAYNLYLKGRYRWNRQTIEGFRSAASEFRNCIARHPAYAPAYAGLADCYCMLATYGAEPPTEAAAIIHEAAQEAIRLDGRLAEAYTALAGTLSFYEWKWEDGERHFRRAIELRPGYALAHHWFGMHLAALGRLDEADQELAAALRLDPLSADINTSVAILTYYRRDFELSAEQVQEAFDLDPGFPAAWDLLGRVRLQQSRFEEALECFDKAAPRSSVALNLGWTGGVFGLWGKKGKSRAILRRLHGMAGRDPASPLALALTYVGLGDHDNALKWLGIGAEGHAVLLSWVGIDPYFENVGRDVRLAGILRRIGVVA